jgi:WD40 repeat protein/DNA-binding XRE family transcriptional regulator
MRRSTYPERDYIFGQHVLTLRTESKLTQLGLAKLLGVSRQAVVGWEAGTSHPSPQHLRQLIELYLQHHAFHGGQEGEEIRTLWQSAHQRVLLDETWLTHLLERPLGLLADGTLQSLAPAIEATKSGPQVDWGDAPEFAHFYGREAELELLKDWLVEKHSRVVSIVGMGGIGKTCLAARVALQVAPLFSYVYWRSLCDAPPPGEWLASAIGFLSEYRIVPPATDAERLVALLQLLRKQRCLLILDNFDTLFEPGKVEESYRLGLAGYGHLLATIGETTHQSCLVLTSREVPPNISILNSDAVRTFSLGGLGINATQLMLAPKQLTGDPKQWDELTDRFGGNSLALKLVGERIRELFGGEIGLYLEEEGVSSVFGGIRQVLTDQVERSSEPEQHVLRVLAIRREPARLADVLVALTPRLSRGSVLEAVEALRRRSLVTRTESVRGASFTLQSVVLEYLTDRLVEEVVEEIYSNEPILLVKQALIQAQVRDFVRQSQERLIGIPILEGLKRSLGQDGTEQRLLALLERWRDKPESEQGYGPGNVVNLLRLLWGHLRGLDLSHLAIRQAYLAEVDTQDARLVDTHLSETVLAEAFSFPSSVALSRDGALLAAGTSTGQVWLWRVADRTLLARLEGQTSPIFEVALSANGNLVISGHGDGTVRLWEVSSGQQLAVLEGHTGGVWGVALSADGHLLASGSPDGTVRLWETSSKRQLAVLKGHTGGVWGIALSADGRLVSSGDGGGTVRIWETSTGRLLSTLEGHKGGVWRVALSIDGCLLASGSADGTLRLWEVASGQLLATLEGHTGGVWGVAVAANGQLLASSGGDGLVRLWDVSSRQLLATLQGHNSSVRGVAFSGDGHLLATGGLDGTLKLWDVSTRQLLATLEGQVNGVCGVDLSADGYLVASGNHDGLVRLWQAPSGRALATLQGHTGPVYAVSLSADGRLVVSGGRDRMIRLWDTSAGRLLATLEGHTAGIWGVALSADGHLVASGSEDETVRLWEVPSGRLLATLVGHTSAVRGVALSADGQLLASGSSDRTVRLWDVSSRQPLATLLGHTGPVFVVALSADGNLVASGSQDGVLRLWEAPSGRPLTTIHGHTGLIWGIALSADGKLGASGGLEGQVRLWDMTSGRLLATMQGHTGGVWGVALSADGHLLASGSWDGTVRLWKTSNGECLSVFRNARCYERLDITGLTGITEAQRQALLALGAFEKGKGVNPEQEIQS